MYDQEGRGWQGYFQDWPFLWSVNRDFLKNRSVNRDRNLFCMFFTFCFVQPDFISVFYQSSSYRNQGLLLDQRQTVYCIALRFGDMIDHRSYAHNLSSCQIYDLSYFHAFVFLLELTLVLLQIISQKDEHCWVGELNGLRGKLL